MKPFFFSSYQVSFRNPSLGLMIKCYKQDYNIWNDAEKVYGISIEVSLLFIEFGIYTGIEKAID
jgi:hypothetical protein